MSLFYNNIEIPNSRGRMYYNGVELEQVYFNGTIVWDVLDVVTEPIVYTTGVNQTWIVPDGVYALGICMVGGGGTGATEPNIPGQTQGVAGKAGNVVNFAVSVVPGQPLGIVIGAGAKVTSNGTYTASTSTFMFGIEAAGGESFSYHGMGNAVTTCGGTENDGSYIIGDYIYPGGQSSGFHKGGEGFYNTVPGIDNHGQMGSGGGAGSYETTPGVWLNSLGGNGVVRLSYNQPV